jgi:hypothetical protein
MPTHPTVASIQTMFRPLNKEAATFPPRKALSDALNKLVKPKDKADYTANVDTEMVKKFATASVEMWHRAIHSYLMSASLTKASPLWSSVSGYYSSHYSIRAFAHLLGYFQLFKARKIVKLNVTGGTFTCTFQGKNAGDREHIVYWELVHKDDLLKGNPFFTKNNEQPNGAGETISDVGHRSIANYADHVNNFPVFQVLDAEELEIRLTKIASLNLSAAPIPRMERYPDLDNVQVIAYQRLVAYRTFLDNILGGDNRFWSKQRAPGWAANYLDYQFIEPKYIEIYTSVSI